MAKEITWESEIEGKSYKFIFETTRNEYILMINNAMYKFSVGFKDMLGIDRPLKVAGKEARLVVFNGKPDVAIDGICLRSGKRYKRRPAWVWAFFIACLLLPLLSLGGLIPTFLGLAGVFLCEKISKTSLPTVASIMLCFLAFSAVWGAWIFMAALFA